LVDNKLLKSSKCQKDIVLPDWDLKISPGTWQGKFTSKLLTE